MVVAGEGVEPVWSDSLLQMAVVVALFLSLGLRMASYQRGMCWLSRRSRSRIDLSRCASWRGRTHREIWPTEEAEQTGEQRDRYR